MNSLETTHFVPSSECSATLAPVRYPAMGRPNSGGMQIRNAIVLFAALSSAVAFADSWPAAKPAGKSSPSGNLVVRVVPGMSVGDVYGFAGEPKGKYATAIYYRLSPGGEYVRYQEVSLLNPVAPVFFALSDAGQLVTLDNWHNMGIGKSIVVYRQDGQVLRSYELNQIYEKADIQKFSVSTSSIAWRCPMAPILESRTMSLEFADALGNIVEVNLKTGTISKQPTKSKEC